jgi:hypothetical protein
MFHDRGRSGRHFVRGRHEQDDRIDHAPPRLGREIDVAHEHEQLGQRVMAHIQDFRRTVIARKLLKQRHLAAHVGNRCRNGELWKELGQRRLAGAEVETKDRPSACVLKLHAQPRYQRLADARACRTYDEEMCRAAHGHPRAKSARNYEQAPVRGISGEGSDHAGNQTIKSEVGPR